MNNEVRLSLDRITESLVEHTESAIIAIDLKGFINHWNPGAALMYGYTAKEMLGGEYQQLIPEDRAGEFRKVLDKVKRGRRLPAFDTVRRHKDGTLIDVRLAVHQVNDEQGNIIGICTVAADISKLMRAERAQRISKAQVEAVVQTVLDGIVTINPKGIIDSVNPAVERIFGYHAHEMIGCNVKMLMPEPYRAEHDGYLHNYMTTGEAKIIGIGREVQGMRKDGSLFPIDLAVNEMTVDGKPAFVGILRDITERKEAEETLHKLSKKHENKVIELAATLEQLRAAQDQLVQSEKMASLGGLVAGVAHEINTPIGVCVTAASFLDDRTREIAGMVEANGHLSEQQLQSYLKGAEQSTKMIMQNLKRAAQLVSSFKQVAADRSSSELRKFKLDRFLQDVVTSLHPVLKRKGHQIDIHCEGELELQTYPGALSQVVTNLIMNAIKHAYAEGEKGQIKIDARICEEEVVMDFRDDGAGIPAENLKKVFDPFFTTARNTGGTGLGLHVVHNLMTEVLGGEIKVTSEPGKGTHFHLVMPRVKDAEVDALRE